MYSQRKVVLNEGLVQVLESEGPKPSNRSKPLKPDYKSMIYTRFSSN